MNEALQQTARRASRVRPSPQQLAWQEMELTTFIHFGMPTFKEEQDWGTGEEDPTELRATGFEPDQWVEVCNEIGSGMLIFTAKHHDGFCLWPTQTTDHNIAASSWKGGEGDMVREVAEACRRGGIKFGIYLSPWDRHEPTYGTPGYHDYFKAQLRELCTGYGDLAEFWFDGACGESAFGVHQNYQWPEYYKIIRDHQPDALIANQGPDLRWGGNEGGVARGDEWSVYGLDAPPEEFRNWKAVTNAAKFEPHTDGMPRLGAEPVADLDHLKDRKHLFWYPAEIDYSLRMYWFWHPNHECHVRTTDQLVETYYRSVGRNGVLLLGLAPDRAGRIPEFDVNRLREWKGVLQDTFDDDFAEGARVEASSAAEGNEPAVIVGPDAAGFWRAADGDAAPVITLKTPEPVSFNRVMIQEMISEGQQVEKWRFDVRFGDRWVTMAGGGAIGHKRLFKLGTLTTDAVRLRLLENRGVPTIRRIGLFRATPGG